LGWFLWANVHFTVNQEGTLIEAQSLIKPLNRHFWVAAVVGS